MKEVFEDLGKKIGETADAVTNKASEVIELQKIKNQMSTLKKGNERDFADLGRMVYSRHKAGETMDADSMALCEAIDEREASLAEFEQASAEVRGAVTCPTCQKTVEKGMVFCPYCGAKVPEDVWKREIRAKVKDTANDIVGKAADIVDDVHEKAADIVEDVHEKLNEEK